jgi:CoA:oxalate CoA-transferase
MTRVLEDVRVLDFGRVVASAFCGTLLADMGADVIKIERPGGEFDRSLGPLTPDGKAMVYELITPRNKKSITLNTRKEKGIKILDELVKQSSIVISGFTPEGNRRMGLDYNRLKQVNPGIIQVAISGYGQNGPYRNRPAFDAIAQAESGGMSYSGFPGNPPTRAALPYVDFSTSIMGAYGAMLALRHLEKTGEGQLVDVAMMDTAFTFVAGTGVLAESTLLNRVRPQIGNNSYYNYTDAFQAKDGWVVISSIGNDIWKRFVRVMDCPDILDDPRFADDDGRYRYRDLIQPVVSEWVARHPVSQILEVLEENRVPCGRVNDVPDLVDHPQLAAREMIVNQDYPNTGTVPAPGIPIKLSKTPGSIETNAPALGEHNTEIYGDLLNYSSAELEEMRREGLI